MVHLISSAPTVVGGAWCGSAPCAALMNASAPSAVIPVRESRSAPPSLWQRPSVRARSPKSATVHESCNTHTRCTASAVHWGKVHGVGAVHCVRGLHESVLLREVEDSPPTCMLYMHACICFVNYLLGEVEVVLRAAEHGLRHLRVCTCARDAWCMVRGVCVRTRPAPPARVHVRA